jgi:uncharacterized protein YjbI with pentapeptide repeats
MLAGLQHSPLVKALLAAMVWTTVVILPLVLLTWAEVRFLPYRDQTVTWVQRAAVGVDLVGLWLFWPLIVTGDHLSRWWRGFFRSLGYHPLLGLRARLRAGLRWIRPRARLRRGTLTRWQRLYTPGGRARASRGLTVTTLAALGLYGLLVTGVWAETVFRRALNLQEAILVRGDPPAEVMAALRQGNDEERARALKRVVGLSLAGRDLRGADFFGAVLPKADLREAGLEGANLRDARLEGTNLREARLEGADLREARLDGADLREAGLERANLRDARLEGANLMLARLERANLMLARLDGANLREARLDGADLIFARLDGANLREARLQGAYLAYARLDGANLRDALLHGADLSFARLEGANLRNAFLRDVRTGCVLGRCTDMTQADLRGAKLTGANLEGACGTDVQLPEGYSVPPCGEADTAPPSSAPSPEASSYAPRITVQQD